MKSDYRLGHIDATDQSQLEYSKSTLTALPFGSGYFDEVGPRTQDLDTSSGQVNTIGGYE